LLKRIIKANGIRHFFSTKDRFDLAFALCLLTDARSGGKSKEGEHRHQGEEGNQGVTFLAPSTKGPGAREVRLGRLSLIVHILWCGPA
jgi:hypothetical protein